MRNKKVNFTVGQYVLLPISYNSSGQVSIDTPFLEEAKNQNGSPRQILRAYFNPNFLGSPVFRRVDETQTRGLRVFIPKGVEDWTVVQIKSVSDKASYGKPVNLEKGLIISYAIKCRELYSKALQFSEEAKTIHIKNLVLPSFEEWMKNKEGYVSLYEREKEQNSEIIISGLKTQIKSLQSRLTNINDKHIKHIEKIKRQVDVLFTDLRTLEIKDDEIENDFEKIITVIENKG